MAKEQPPETAPAPAPYSHPLRVASLATRKPTRFKLIPNAAERAALAATLDLLDLPKVAFIGELRPTGSRDFILEADLQADVVQPCSITLAPVPASVSEKVNRRYMANWIAPEGDEIEMPEDDSVEALPEVIDLGDVLTEALALSLPLYPRAPGAELGEAVFAEPGVEPLKDEALKPFAGLAALKAKLTGSEDAN